MVFVRWEYKICVLDLVFDILLPDILPLDRSYVILNFLDRLFFSIFEIFIMKMTHDDYFFASCDPPHLLTTRTIFTGIFFECKEEK